MTPPSYAAINIAATGRRIRRAWRAGRWLIAMPLGGLALDEDEYYRDYSDAFWTWLDLYRYEILSAQAVFLVLFVVAKYTRRPVWIWALPITLFALHRLIPSFFLEATGPMRGGGGPNLILRPFENPINLLFVYLGFCVVSAILLARGRERLVPMAARESLFAMLRRRLGVLRFDTRGLLLVVLGGLAGLPALVGLAPFAVPNLATVPGGTGQLLWKFMLAAPITLLLSILLLRRGSRRLKVDALTALRRDPRQPILLLRSFADDGKQIWPGSFVLRLILRRRRLEEIAGRAISRVGPFIAIGIPGEKLPELGAFRAYFEESEWRGAVLRWAEDARLIFMVGGVTAAVQWELRAILERGLTTKLILLVPPGRREDRVKRLAFLGDCFAGTPFAPAIAAALARPVLALCFHADGRVVGIESRSRREADYFVATNTAVDYCLGGPSVGRSKQPPRERSLSIANWLKRRFA
jgi:hypothetical protein